MTKKYDLCRPSRISPLPSGGVGLDCLLLTLQDSLRDGSTPEAKSFPGLHMPFGSPVSRPKLAGLNFLTCSLPCGRFLGRR